jgi:two-component system response regulator DevR
LVPRPDAASGPFPLRAPAGSGTKDPTAGAAAHDDGGWVGTAPQGARLLAGAAGSVGKATAGPRMGSVERRETHVPIRVFLLDDHEIVRRGLRELLEIEDDIEIVGESGSAQEATRRIPALRPDVALLDARLPDGSGIDTCRDVRSVDPGIAALIVTSYDDEQALANAIAAGAAGYVLKDVRGNDLVASIRRVAAGESLIDEARRARVRERWDAGRQDDPRLQSLSPQERRILQHIADGLTNRQIGEVMSLAEKTVKNYVTGILAKLGMQRRTQAAVFAAQHGTTARGPGQSG